MVRVSIWYLYFNKSKRVKNTYFENESSISYKKDNITLFSVLLFVIACLFGITNINNDSKGNTYVATPMPQPQSNTQYEAYKNNVNIVELMDPNTLAQIKEKIKLNQQGFSTIVQGGNIANTQLDNVVFVLRNNTGKTYQGMKYVVIVSNMFNDGVCITQEQSYFQPITINNNIIKLANARLFDAGNCANVLNGKLQTGLYITQLANE